MAATRNTTASLIKPLNGSIVRRYTAGAAISAGMPVAMQSDGFVDPADASAFDQVIGVAIAATSAAAEQVDVVIFGPVFCLTGATIGANIYISDTAGQYAETVGTKDLMIGWAETANILVVSVQHIDFS